MIKDLNIEFESGLASRREPLFVETAVEHIGWVASKKIKEASKPSTWGATTSIVVAFLFVIGMTMFASNVMAKVEWYGKTQNAWWVKSVIAEEATFEKEVTEKEYNKNYLAKPIVLSLRETIHNLVGIRTANAQTTASEKWNGKLHSQSYSTINIDSGKGITIDATFLNQGSYTWFNNNDAYVRLISKSNSEMYHEFWKNSSEITKLTENSVIPGETGLLRFAIKAPENGGIYTETFELYGGNNKIEGGTVTITLNVKGEAPSEEVIVNGEYTELQESIIDGSAGDSDTPITEPVVEEVAEVELLEENILDTKESEGNVTLYEGDIFVEEGIFSTSTPVVYEEPEIFEQSIRMVEPTIRVGLYELEDFIILASPLDYRIGSEENETGVLINGEARTVISYDEFAKKYVAISGPISVSSEKIRIIPVTSDGHITLLNYTNQVTWDESLNHNRFRGVIEVARSEKTNSSWVVNELPIKDYLKGLSVTSEVSPIEYHKSIAIAARSYALWQKENGTRHTGKPFDVDAKNDQVYKGFNSEIRIPTFVNAVKETEGVVVTYEDAVALTPYFAQSDGRTRSYAEVWGDTDKPYLMSVSDITNEGLRIFGHGVGMSARGALIQVSRFGYTFNEVFHHYYTNIDLKQIYKEGVLPAPTEEK